MQEDKRISSFVKDNFEITSKASLFLEFEKHRIDRETAN